MAIQVRADDGTMHSFPDGTSTSVIWRAMNNYNTTQRSTLQSLMTFPADLLKGREIGIDTWAKWRRIAEEQNKGIADPKQKKGIANNDIDAQRHADWTRRMAQTFGPRNAARIGELHEIEGWVGDMVNPRKAYDPLAARMDRYNNAVGVRSVRQGRPYSLDELQLTREGHAANLDLGLGSYDPYRRQGPRR